MAGLLAGLLTGLQTGCATTQGGVTIDSARGSFAFVRRVVVGQLPGGIRQISQNGREMDSGYFTPDATKFQIEASQEVERACAHVQILGSRRPYSINVRVYREEAKPNGGYRNVGSDEKLSAELARRIRDDLANRREDHNIIDDFRAF